MTKKDTTAMQEVNQMFETLNWQDFLTYMINALPMLIDKEKEQITKAYQKADIAYFKDSIADAENYYNQTYKS